MTPEKDSAGIFKPGSIVNTMEETKKECAKKVPYFSLGITVEEVKKSTTNYLGKCLDEAKNIINSERQDSYGNPEDSFELIAEYWNVYLTGKIDLTSKDVAHMIMLFKLARCQGQSPSRDNYIDIAGYASIAADRLSDTCKEGE